MKLMKLLMELGAALDKAQAEKAAIEEKVTDVDQAIAGIFGECEKKKAFLTHIRCKLTTLIPSSTLPIGYG